MAALLRVLHRAWAYRHGASFVGSRHHADRTADALRHGRRGRRADQPAAATPRSPSPWDDPRNANASLRRWTGAVQAVRRPSGRADLTAGSGRSQSMERKMLSEMSAVSDPTAPGARSPEV